MLFLANDHNSIGHGHVDFVLVVPMIGTATIAQRHIEIVIVLARCLDSLWHTHLFADVLCVMTFLKNRILLVAVSIICWAARQCHFAVCVCACVLVSPHKFSCLIYKSLFVMVLHPYFPCRQAFCVAMRATKIYWIVVQGEEKKKIYCLTCDTPYWIIQLHSACGSHCKTSTRPKLVRRGAFDIMWWIADNFAFISPCHIIMTEIDLHDSNGRPDTFWMGGHKLMGSQLEVSIWHRIRVNGHEKNAALYPPRVNGHTGLTRNAAANLPTMGELWFFSFCLLATIPHWNFIWHFLLNLIHTHTHTHLLYDERVIFSIFCDRTHIFS